MDNSLIVSIVIAVVAIVPGVWALVNQANKDKTQARLDMNAAAQNAAMGIISPLQTEVARLQARVLELEKALIDKTTEIGELMQQNIDKDSQIRTLKYNMEDMQLRLNTFENKRKGKTQQTENNSGPSIIDPRLEEDLKEDEKRKLEIQHHTDKAIRQITGSSTGDLETLTEGYAREKKIKERAEDLAISQERRDEDLRISEERRAEDLEAQEQINKTIIDKN
jgi:hypothetical protein